ncbi:MAG TPA: hypothetical protein VLX91_04665 [Candidatus Acidoferrales bacterium]|nr:hypothetical protein [Candidatus Acidoferrales bacterium]
MKQSKKHSDGGVGGKNSQRQPQKISRSKTSHKDIDMQQLGFEVEVAVYEVDKIFEGQGDKLSDQYVVDSLGSFVKVIKDESYASYSEKLKEGSDDESDLLHINIVNRLSAAIEELELQVTDLELIDVVKQVLAAVKKSKSTKSSRAYLDSLAKRLKEMGIKSDFLTETDVEGETIPLDDLDNLDDLSFNDDDLDLDDPKLKY